MKYLKKSFKPNVRAETVLIASVVPLPRSVFVSMLVSPAFPVAVLWIVCILTAVEPLSYD